MSDPQIPQGLFVLMFLYMMVCMAVAYACTMTDWLNIRRTQPLAVKVLIAFPWPLTLLFLFLFQAYRSVGLRRHR